MANELKNKHFLPALQILKLEFPLSLLGPYAKNMPLATDMGVSKAVSSRVDFLKGSARVLQGACQTFETPSRPSLYIKTLCCLLN
jgi:hypothetical protein